MNTILKSNETGPTFETRVVGLMNTRRVDVTNSTRELVIEELGLHWAGACYALMGIQREINYGRQIPEELDPGLLYFRDASIGTVFKVTPTRVQFEPSLEFIESLKTTSYLKEDHLHKGSLVVPVGCLGWILLLTYRDGIVTVDHLPRNIEVARNVFIRRGLLEPLRRILRSRNVYHPIPMGTKFGLRLHKSTLSLGTVDYLKADLTKAIQERLAVIYERCFGSAVPPSFGFEVSEVEHDRWHRVYTVKVSWGHGFETVAATIKLIDKTFFLEI